MTRKWLITILVALAIILIAVWLYTAYAAEEVEPEVAEEERVGLVESRPVSAGVGGAGLLALART